jgi:hypothetical protein
MAAGSCLAAARTRPTPAEPARLNPGPRARSHPASAEPPRASAEPPRECGVIPRECGATPRVRSHPARRRHSGAPRTTGAAGSHPRKGAAGRRPRRRATPGTGVSLHAPLLVMCFSLLTFGHYAASVRVMAPARVRGCVGQVSPSPGYPPWQADASRRRNGPRKATSRRLITVRLRSKSCPAGGPDVPRAGRRAVVAQLPRNPQQADVGSKTRSAGRVPFSPTGQKGVP